MEVIANMFHVKFLDPNWIFTAGSTNSGFTSQTNICRSEKPLTAILKGPRFLSGDPFLGQRTNCSLFLGHLFGRHCVLSTHCTTCICRSPKTARNRDYFSTFSPIRLIDRFQHDPSAWVSPMDGQSQLSILRPRPLLKVQFCREVCKETPETAWRFGKRIIIPCLQLVHYAVYVHFCTTLVFLWSKS